MSAVTALSLDSDKITKKQGPGFVWMKKAYGTEKANDIVQLIFSRGLVQLQIGTSVDKKSPQWLDWKDIIENAPRRPHLLSVLRRLLYPIYQLFQLHNKDSIPF